MTNTQDNKDTLGSIFQAWRSAFKPKNYKGTFLQETGLSELITESDLQKLIDGKACFSKETVMSVYGLLPLKLRLNNIEVNLFPQVFYRLNHRALQQKEAEILNISLSRADAVYQERTVDKLKFVKENMNHLRHENGKAKNPQSLRDAYRRYYKNLSEEEKERRNEKSKLRMRRYREAHPETVQINNQKAKERFEKLSEIEKLSKKIDNRMRNKQYRETHKEELAAKQRLYRKNLDPEIAKQRQLRYYLSEGRKQSSKAYYERHKQEIMAKAKENPHTKINQRRYKIKKRFQERTGVKILSLLQALANAKSK